MAPVFNRDFEPRYGDAVAVAPSVRRVTARNPGPFTFLGTNTFLIGGNDLAILDPGPDDKAHLEAVLRTVGTARVRHILISHSHHDHVAGLRGLQEETGAPVLAARTARAAAGPADPIGNRLDAAGDPAFAPDEGLADGTIIAGETYRLEAIATPGHAADHLAFAVAGENVLFPGDHVMGWSTTVVAPPDGNMGDYMASLDRLLARRETYYLPAHGPAIERAPDYVRGLKTHRLMRERAIVDRLARGDRTVPEVVARIYSDLDPKLHAAAALSTLAHLQDLKARGVVSSSGDASLGASYWLGASASPSTGASGSAGAGSGAPGSS